MNEPKRYVGINNDLNGGMTDTGKIIRDAWVFGLIPETETCEGWLASGLEDLWRKVNEQWELYGFQVSKLPPDMQAKFLRLHQQAFEQAKAAGWDAENELAGD